MTSIDRNICISGRSPSGPDGQDRLLVAYKDRLDSQSFELCRPKVKILTYHRRACIDYRTVIAMVTREPARQALNYAVHRGLASHAVIQDTEMFLV